MFEDVSIFIDGKEFLDLRPTFESPMEFVTFVYQLAENKGNFAILLDHPHNETSDVLSVHIGTVPREQYEKLIKCDKCEIIHAS